MAPEIDNRAGPRYLWGIAGSTPRPGPSSTGSTQRPSSSSHGEGGSAVSSLIEDLLSWFCDQLTTVGPDQRMGRVARNARSPSTGRDHPYGAPLG